MDHQTSGLHSHSSQSGFQWLSFAYQGLTEIPYGTILPQTGTLQVLDLSYNRLEEYPFHQGRSAPARQTGAGMKAGFCEAGQQRAASFRLFFPSLVSHWNPALLGQLHQLSTLVLDGNHYTSHIKFPYLPSVTTLYINKNRLNNLPVFVEEIRRKVPNIK